MDFDIELGRTSPLGHLLSVVALFSVSCHCVVANGKIIASEGVSGTDKMLKDIIVRKIRFKNEGVLVKLAKPIQDRRVDLPAIGMKTIELIKEIGIAGIALEEKSSFISEKEKVIEFANENNIFIFGISNGKT